jgi:hypothetical protein
MQFTNNSIIFDFNKDSNLKNWKIVDDVVMGGKSSGHFELNDDGHAVFYGNISLENNGGFSSVRYQPKRIELNKASTIHIRLKGDTKKYQLRIKANASDYYSYVTSFSTSGEWQTIEISLQEMYPTFRGRKLDQPNFSDDHIEEIGILIGNKKEQEFKLMIDKIELK